MLSAQHLPERMEQSPFLNNDGYGPTIHSLPPSISTLSDRGDLDEDEDQILREELKELLDRFPQSVFQRNSLSDLFDTATRKHNSGTKGSVPYDSNVMLDDRPLFRDVQRDSPEATSLEVARLQILYSSQMRRVKELESKLQKEASEIDNLHHKIVARDKELANVMIDLETTTSELQRCRVQVEEQDDTIVKCNNKIRELGHYKAMILAELEAAKLSASQSQSELEENKKLRSNLSVVELENQIADMTKNHKIEITRLTNSLHQALRKVDDIENVQLKAEAGPTVVTVTQDASCQTESDANTRFVVNSQHAHRSNVDLVDFLSINSPNSTIDEESIDNSTRLDNGLIDEDTSNSRPIEQLRRQYETLLREYESLRDSKNAEIESIRAESLILRDTAVQLALSRAKDDHDNETEHLKHSMANVEMEILEVKKKYLEIYNQLTNEHDLQKHNENDTKIKESPNSGFNVRASKAAIAELCQSKVFAKRLKKEYQSIISRMIASNAAQAALSVREKALTVSAVKSVSVGMQTLFESVDASAQTDLVDQHAMSHNNELQRLKEELLKIEANHCQALLMARSEYSRRIGSMQSAVAEYVKGARVAKARAFYELVSYAQGETARSLNIYYASKIQGMADVVVKTLDSEETSLPLSMSTVDRSLTPRHSGNAHFNNANLDSSILMTPSPTPSPSTTP